MKYEWNYDELDEIYFQKSDAELDCINHQNRGFCQRKGGHGHLGPEGKRIYKGDEGKFLKDLQECLNWDEPQNDIADEYTYLMRVGYQPELITLNQLETIDEHVEWKRNKDNKRKQKIERERKMKELEAAQKQKHLQWKKEVEEEKAQAKLTFADNRVALHIQSALKNKVQLTKDALSQIDQESGPKRIVTFDLVTSRNDSKMTNNTGLSHHQLNLLNAKADQEFKTLDSSFKMSESSKSTAFTSAAGSNHRYMNTPSPTKFRRDKQNFALVASNIIKNAPASPSPTSRFSSKQSLNLNSKTDISTQSLPKIGKTDFLSTQAFSPKADGQTMPGFSLFDFSNRKINERMITSQRGNRGNYSPMKKYETAQH